MIEDEWNGGSTRQTTYLAIVDTIVYGFCLLVVILLLLMTIKMIIEHKASNVINRHILVAAVATMVIYAIVPLILLITSLLIQLEIVSASGLINQIASYITICLYVFAKFGTYLNLLIRLYFGLKESMFRFKNSQYLQCFAFICINTIILLARMVALLLLANSYHILKIIINIIWFVCDIGCYSSITCAIAIRFYQVAIMMHSNSFNHANRNLSFALVKNARVDNTSTNNNTVSQINELTMVSIVSSNNANNSTTTLTNVCKQENLNEMKSSLDSKQIQTESKQSSSSLISEINTNATDSNISSKQSMSDESVLKLRAKQRSQRTKRKINENNVTSSRAESTPRASIINSDGSDRTRVSVQNWNVLNTTGNRVRSTRVEYSHDLMLTMNFIIRSLVLCAMIVLWSLTELIISLVFENELHFIVFYFISIDCVLNTLCVSLFFNFSTKMYHCLCRLCHYCVATILTQLVG